MSFFKSSLIVGILGTTLIQSNAMAQNTLTINSFSDWCSQEASLPLATQKTINAIVKALRVENCSQVAEMAPKIFSINVSSQGISDLRPLSTLVNTSELILYDNEIIDITPLRSMTNLNKLILGHNQISDLTPLKNLTNLEKLYITDNKIEEIKPLENLTKLKTLYLNQNNISDLKPLENLTNLQELYLDNNKIGSSTVVMTN